MLTPIANFHHSKLPKPGEIGYLIREIDRYRGPNYWHGRQRVIVESFPLCDNEQWRGHFYSYGIHTCTFRFLGTGKRVRMSGFYFVSEEDM